MNDPRSEKHDNDNADRRKAPHKKVTGHHYDFAALIEDEIRLDVLFSAVPICEPGFKSTDRIAMTPRNQIKLATVAIL